MEKVVRADLWIEEGVRYRAFLNDFDGDVAKWKNAFYEIWRYQMTWHFAYEIGVHECSDKDVCISVLVRPAYKDNAKDMLEAIGCRNIHTEVEAVGVVPTYDIDDPAAETMMTVVAE